MTKMGNQPLAFEDLDSKHLECRDLGHAWTFTQDSSIVFSTVGLPVEFERRMICMRCESERVQVLSLPNMEVRSSRYTYAEGYRFKNGHGHKEPRRLARVEHYRRQRNGVL